MQIDLNEINVPQQELQDVINRSMVSVRRMHRRKLFFRVVSRCSAAQPPLSPWSGSAPPILPSLKISR